MDKIQEIIKRIQSFVPQGRKIKIMNVCGSHEHTIAYSGIRSVVPDNLELIPGPGCPVCVCPESDIVNAIRLSKREDVILVTYGDMLRVPAQDGSIRTEGKNYRMITSLFECLDIARANPEKKIVFFSIGFETTTAPTAAILEMGVPDNLYILSSHRLTPTIMEVLVKDTEIGIDGFIAPGHVSAIIGSNAWNVFSEKYGIPTVVAGFEAENLLLGILEVLRQLMDEEARTSNVYKSVVKPEGNKQAQKIIAKYFKVAHANWRGIGYIPYSGLELRDEYSVRDAKKVFMLREVKEKNTAGCICAQIIFGKSYPSDCTLFRKACNPKNPRGPCMVSFEGACNIWYKTNAAFTSFS
ncbi:MAG: hydrogenase formation protein HypD [Thermodesulfovibrionia bacterium]|nr:hydrogenase formation protein HypD [Thermodesulfovibrionia bacterium]